ncbi:MAG: DNA repair exonuclease, partial [Candidatus Aenigmatarchaeota archaeon]
MKIAILSDFHFGFSYTSEIENDSFENAEEAIKRALDCDLILIAGDIFDSRTPRTSVLAKGVNILVKPLLQENKGVKLISSSKELKAISQRVFNHLPVIAIHGTHERGGKDSINPIQALENAGILIHLHCDTIVLEKNGEKVAIHGMSGVPERYAKDVLEKWSPKPVENCFNILLLHQSIAPFIYSPLEPPSLNISNLPKGFDLIVDGHLHLSEKEKFDNTTLIFPGSTIVTQFEANEAVSEKGFFKLEIREKAFEIDFIRLENNRKFFYEELKLSKDFSTREQIENKIKNILRKEFKKKPLIKVKLTGK